MRLGRRVREVVITPARPPVPEPIRLPERPAPTAPQPKPGSPERDPAATPTG